MYVERVLVERARIGYEPQREMYLHATYAVSAQRVPLGVLDAWMWARERKQADGSRGGLLESVRWVEGYERLAELAAKLPATRLVCVGDRESDLLALLVRARDLGHAADYLLRCQHNRVLPEGGKLWAAVMQSAPLGRLRFELPAGRGRKARTVEQELRAQRLRLDDRQGGHVEVTCLIAAEVDTPAGAKPITWRLLTNCEVPTLEAACELIDWYRCWEIELLFLTLKEGCRVDLPGSGRLRQTMPRRRRSPPGKCVPFSTQQPARSRQHRQPTSDAAGRVSLGGLAHRAELSLPDELVPGVRDIVPLLFAWTSRCRSPSFWSARCRSLS